MYTGFRDVPAAVRGRLRRDPAISSGPRSSARRRVPGFVWGLGIVSLLTDVSTEMVGSSLPLYLSTWLRVGPIALASVDAVQQVMTAVMRLGSSLFADRTRRHRAAAAAGYVTSAFSRLLLVFGLPSTTTVGASVIVDRVGKGIRTGPRDAMITEGTAPERLGAAFGVHRALDAVGAFGGPLLTFVILRSTNGTGFRAVFAVAAIVGFVGVAALLLLVPAPAVVAPRVRGASRRRAPLPLAVLAGVIGCCTVGDALVLIVLLRSASLANSTYPLMAVAASIVFAVLAGPTGRLADRVNPVRVFLAGTALLAITYLALGTGLPSASIGVFAVLAAIGCSYAATDGVLAALVARVGDAGSAATGQAVVQTATAVGRAIGSTLFGLLWAGFGAARAFTILGAALLTVSIGAAVTSPRWLHTRMEAEELP